MEWRRNMPYKMYNKIYNIEERTPLLKSETVLVLPEIDTEYDDDLNNIRSFQGLSLEELLVFKDHPLWEPLRRALFCSFWLTILFCLFAACLLSYMHADTCSTMSRATSNASSSGIQQNYMSYNHSVLLAF